MNRALIAVAAIGIATSASAQIVRAPVIRGPIIKSPIIRGPIIVARPLPGTRLVENPDGSFVSDIDGKRGNFGFRPGSIHSIRGQGFGRKSNANVLLLKSADGRYNANLIVTRWDDDLIVAQVPTDQSNFPSADKLTLLIMTSGTNSRQFRIQGGSFKAEEAEVKLTMTTWERAALEAAGLRVRVWNRGKEILTFERDGSVTVTHYIDFPKDKRTSLCPAPGSERIDLNLLTRGLKLQPGFRISRIAMTHGPADGHFTGRYADAWQAIDDAQFYTIDWGVWRFRRDASFDIAKPFEVGDGTFGKHTKIPGSDTVYTACGSEFTLTVFVTGPRGLSPR